MTTTRRGIVALAITALMVAFPASAHAYDGNGRRANDEHGFDTAIIYFGLSEDGRYFETVPLDGSKSENNRATDPHKRFPINRKASATVVENGVARQQPSEPLQPESHLPLYCERRVHSMYFTGRLEGSVEQWCSGDFLAHWIDEQVQRSSWSGYRSYTNLHSRSATSTGYRRWFISEPCGSDGTFGTYNYRTNTRGWARLHDGRIVGGNYIYGGYTRQPCGTGVS